MKTIAKNLLVVLALVALGACGGGSVHLEMGGLTRDAVEPMSVNAAAMNCQLRRGLGRVALRCPGIAYPDESVDLVIWMDGRVECVARTNQEDDCPLVAEALLRRP